MAFVDVNGAGNILAVCINSQFWTEPLTSQLFVSTLSPALYLRFLMYKWGSWWTGRLFAESMKECNKCSLQCWAHSESSTNIAFWYYYFLHYLYMRIENMRLFLQRSFTFASNRGSIKPRVYLVAQPTHACLRPLILIPSIYICSWNETSYRNVQPRIHHALWAMEISWYVIRSLVNTYRHSGNEQGSLAITFL